MQKAQSRFLKLIFSPESKMVFLTHFKSKGLDLALPLTSVSPVRVDREASRMKCWQNLNRFCQIHLYPLLSHSERSRNRAVILEGCNYDEREFSFKIICKVEVEHHFLKIFCVLVGLAVLFQSLCTCAQVCLFVKKLPSPLLLNRRLIILMLCRAAIVLS